MAITTYTELKSALVDWIARGDITTSSSIIADAITLAEEDFGRELATLPTFWKVKSDVSLASHAGSFTLPIGSLGLIRARLISPVFGRLNIVPIEKLLQDQGDTTAYGQPHTCAMGESANAGTVTVRVWPYADQAYTIEAVYPQVVTDPLSGSTSSNFLLARFPSLYLYGALVQCIPYLGAERRAAMWESRYQRALSGIKDQMWSGDMHLTTELPTSGGSFDITTG